MSHRTKLFWFPAYDRYEIRCLDCGEVLVQYPSVDEFEMPGECEPPPTLGVNVVESITVKDRPGG